MIDADELLRVLYPTPPPSSGMMKEMAPPPPPVEPDEERREGEMEQQYFEIIDSSNRQHLPPGTYGAISQYALEIFVCAKFLFTFKANEPKKGIIHDFKRSLEI